MSSRRPRQRGRGARHPTRTTPPALRRCRCSSRGARSPRLRQVLVAGPGGDPPHTGNHAATVRTPRRRGIRVTSRTLAIALIMPGCDLRISARPPPNRTGRGAHVTHVPGVTGRPGRQVGTPSPHEHRRRTTTSRHPPVRDRCRNHQHHVRPPRRTPRSAHHRSRSSSGPDPLRAPTNSPTSRHTSVNSSTS